MIDTNAIIDLAVRNTLVCICEATNKVGAAHPEHGPVLGALCNALLKECEAIRVRSQKETP